MSNIDKQALREAAEKALPAMQRLLMMPNDELFDEALLNVDGDVDAANAFNLLTGPETVLALLDELEALKLANAVQDDHINQQQDRIDLLEKGNNEAAKQINSWRRLAKQNIAEREKDVSELNIARKRIAELEARTVTLPENITSANAPEVFEISSEAERLGLRGTYASYAVGWNARGIADEEALREAGVKVAAAGKGEAL
ncbi:ead/Ea22-like family protein [Enterobacter hormaechei subsp. steigerwaltii]|nr:ead/Ea22-like family protein [Enterobacter hormaechei subsp. steigerwaltii]MCU2519502.1 ead/Ea22-like family protein [Enterobacter hormaechei subsp. steigerwaltii]MCU3253843.1 ead/Ea22-like family protein [Enterobacter hormaechei subsp. steigerwaltii]MCU3586605.1 ead/Ea22-like family protein [Enterobacter hormaechei subsp. steigerwaltii]MCU3797885.1 ead/Ea22-like family protein [Enterobacter hormaechei subsp. steigerwaltii]